MTLQLDPKVREELISVQKELFSRGELHSQKSLEKYHETFRMRFGPERLAELDGEELLETMHAHGNRESLVYWLEFKDDEELPVLRNMGTGMILCVSISEMLNIDKNRYCMISKN